jgi:hypothetical protein
MGSNIYGDMSFMGVSMAAGFCMAFAYNLLRLFRMFVRHGRLAIDIEDIIYWICCFGAAFVLLYYMNNGVIRFVAVAGAAIGVKISHFVEKYVKIGLTAILFKHKIESRRLDSKIAERGETRRGKSKTGK